MISKVSDGKFHGRTPTSCSTSFRYSKPTSLPSEVVTRTAVAPRSCMRLAIFPTGSLGRNVAGPFLIASSTGDLGSDESSFSRSSPSTIRSLLMTTHLRQPALLGEPAGEPVCLAGHVVVDSL